MMSNKPQFVGEKVELGKLLLDTFSGEWGMEEGESLTPVLRTSNFNEDGSLDYASPAMRCVPEKKVEKKRMVRGDIILEKSGGTPQRPVGIMAFYDSDALALCSNFNQVLRFREDRILPRFAFHQLRWLKDRSAFDRYTRKTTGLQNLQMKKLIELKLRVPQIEVQVSIAGALDEIVGDQQALRQEVASLDSLVKSRFVEMFGDPMSNPMGWDIGSVEDYSENLDSKRVPITSTNRQPGPYPYIGASGEVDRVAGYLFDEPLLLVSEDGANLLMRSTPIAFSIEGKNWVNNHAHVLRCNSQSIRVYMERAINMTDVTPWVSGSAQPKLNQKMLNRIPIMKVPEADMEEFAAFVAQVDKSRFAYIWSRTKSVEQALSGPSLTLVIQHIEPQTRSKYRADVLASPSWPSVDAMLVLKTPHVCVLILVGLVEAIRARCLPGVM